MDLLRARIKDDQVIDWTKTFDTLKESTQKDYSEWRKAVIDYYNKLPQERRTDRLTSLVNQLREQESQTVYRYTVPKK